MCFVTKPNWKISDWFRDWYKWKRDKDGLWRPQGGKVKKINEVLPNVILIWHEWCTHALFTPPALSSSLHYISTERKSTEKTTGRDMKTHELNIWSITNYTNDFFCGRCYCCCCCRRTLAISIWLSRVYCAYDHRCYYTRYELLILVRVSCSL